MPSNTVAFIILSWSSKILFHYLKPPAQICPYRVGVFIKNSRASLGLLAISLIGLNYSLAYLNHFQL